MRGEGTAGDERRARRRKALARRTRRRRRLVALALVLAMLAPGIYSYTRWMLRPSSMSSGVRSVEWVRTQPGGNWLVDKVEHVYYSWKAPRKGGPQLTALPTVGETVAAAPRIRASPWPRRIKPIFAHPLAGEGVWTSTGPPINGKPPVLVTTFRPELEYPRVVAYVAWFDHTRTAVAFYPGRYEPPDAPVRGPAMVPYSQRWRLLATFNAGFTYRYGGNGSTINGRINEPLERGIATLVGYRDGRIGLVKWDGGPNARGVAWTRQSLPPIVWNGKINPDLDSSLKWGETIGNTLRVWRTGVGVDRRGNLIFVAADAQSVVSLATILRHAGAVSAMQFDINPYWHTLITYRHRHGLVPTMVEPQPNHSAQRYLVPDDRDFFAVYRRLPGPVTVPLE
ncbi:MAG TPA: phosphodiester glycosidase family protein [Gaiellaceae bacterium]